MTCSKPANKSNQLVYVGMYIWRSGSKQILVPKAGGQVPFGKTQSIDPRRQIRQTEPGFATDGHGASRLKPSHGKSNVTKYIKISTSKCFSHSDHYDHYDHYVSLLYHY